MSWTVERVRVAFNICAPSGVSDKFSQPRDVKINVAVQIVNPIIDRPKFDVPVIRACLGINRIGRHLLDCFHLEDQYGGSA
jgi:hypothetical protein